MNGCLHSQDTFDRIMTKNIQVYGQGYDLLVPISEVANDQICPLYHQIVTPMVDWLVLYCYANDFFLLRVQVLHIQGGEPKIALSLYNRQQSQVQFLVPHPVCYVKCI